MTEPDSQNSQSAPVDAEPSGNGNSRDNPVEGNGMIPQVVHPPLVPLPSTQAMAGGSSGVPLRGLIGALRRCWFVAIGLGLMCGLAAAATAYFCIPAPYTAFSELRISSVHEKILFNTAEEQAPFKTYKQTQMRLVTNPFVLNAALRKPDVAKLGLFHEIERPMEWLEDNVKVNSPAEEFLKISLSGERPKDLAKVVNEITSAYLLEVVEADKNERKERMENLGRIRREREEQLRTKRQSLRNLANSLESGNTTQADAKQQQLLELHVEMRRQLSKIYFELMEARLQLAAMTSDVQNLDETTDDGKRIQITSALGKDITVKVTETDNGKNVTSEFRAPDLDTLKSDSPVAAAYYEQYVVNRPLSIPDSALEFQLSQEPEVAELEIRIRRQEAYIRNLSKSVSDPKNPRRAASEEKLAEMEKNLAQVRQEIKPRVIERFHTMHTARSEATEGQLRQQIGMLEAEQAQLQRELDDVKTKERKTGILSFDLEALEKDIEQGEAILKSITDEIQKLSIELETPVRVQLHRTAEVPHTRELKRKITGTVFAGMGLFALVVGGMVWFEFQAHKISSADEVVDDLNMRIVGSLPNMPRWVTNGGQRKADQRGVFWKSVLTESIDSARTMLLREASLGRLNVVMVASAMGSEGKTTLSCHLATSLARAGRKTLLIDCDIRRPSIHKVFGLPISPGVCELLAASAEFADCQHTVTQHNLSVVTSGKVSQDVLQRLAKDGLDHLFEQYRKEFDFIIVDSAPVLPVTDSLLIAQSADAVIFSIRRDVSRVAKVAAATQRLGMLGVPVLGTVVIGLDDGSYSFRYPYRRGYGYGYNGRSGYGYPNHPTS